MDNKQLNTELEREIAKKVKTWVYNEWKDIFTYEKMVQRYKEHIFSENLPNATDLQKSIGALSGKKILDLGSGVGGTATAMGLKGAYVVGIDPNVDGIYASRFRAKRYKNINVFFGVAVGENLPFKSKVFDTVVCQNSLEHVQNMTLTLKEIKRVLKRSGFVWIEGPNNLWFREWHYKIFWPPLFPKRLGKVYLRLRGRNPKVLDEINYLTPGWLKNRLRMIGFNKINNLYQKRLEQLFDKPQTIKIRRYRQLLHLLKFLHLHQVIKFILLKLGVYPIIRISAKE